MAQKNQKNGNLKAPKPKFKMQPMTKLEKEAERKANIAKAPVPPNRDMSMKGCP